MKASNLSLWLLLLVSVNPNSNSLKSQLVHTCEVSLSQTESFNVITQISRDNLEKSVYISKKRGR